MPGEQITVLVNLSATLRVYQPELKEDGLVAATLATASTVGDLLDHMAVPRDAAKLIFMDHTRRQLNDPLIDGARVDIFPLIAGG